MQVCKLNLARQTQTKQVFGKSTWTCAQHYMSWSSLELSFESMEEISFFSMTFTMDCWRNLSSEPLFMFFQYRNGWCCTKVYLNLKWGMTFPYVLSLSSCILTTSGIWNENRMFELVNLTAWHTWFRLCFSWSEKNALEESKQK